MVKTVWSLLDLVPVGVKCEMAIGNKIVSKDSLFGIDVFLNYDALLATLNF
jgi:hypothetical protein